MATEPPRCATSRGEAERLPRGVQGDALPGSAAATAVEEEEAGEGTGRLFSGCVPLSHQVAGHMYGKDKGGILQHPDGTVLKQLQPPPRGPRELEFYNKVYAAGCEDPVFLELQKYLPKYYGTWSPPTAPNDFYLKLEDVTHRFKKPCIMDVKIGQKSYDPYASAEKIKQQVSKYPLMEEIGFLVLGMRQLSEVSGKKPFQVLLPEILLTEYARDRSWDLLTCRSRALRLNYDFILKVYQVSSDTYETQNQHYGRGLTKETIKDGMARFFSNGHNLRKDVVAASIKKIKEILQWFESQKQLNFYASSLLFVYDGSSQMTTATWLNDGTLVEKRRVSKGQVPGVNRLEYNNNIHVINPTENGKVETSVGKSFSKMYALHKRHQSQISLKVESVEQDNIWKSSACLSQEHLNGNVIPQLEKVFCHMPTTLPESVEVEVRMIDFAHVFPSNTRDEGYIHGLKNLITVLQNILDT